MIYTFKSKATSDLIMLGATGDRVMGLLGRSPLPKGIFEVKDLPQLIAALEAAVNTAAQTPASQPQAKADEQDAGVEPADAVALRARVWPLVDMMRAALQAREPIVWGV